MVTTNVEKMYDYNSTYIEGSCLSADTKPTTGIANGSILMEMDTSTLYMFDEANSTWRAW